MQLVINGVAVEVEAIVTVADLLALRGLDRRWVVVALNECCVPRAELDATTLSSGDIVEILSPMQGG